VERYRAREVTRKESDIHSNRPIITASLHITLPIEAPASGALLPTLQNPLFKSIKRLADILNTMHR